jgi:hypothetical protein
MEIWKPIIDHPEYYISNLGRVKKNDKILNQYIDNGYHRVCFKNKNFKVHRLIGIAFIPNPDNKPFIDHINRNRSDNSLNNLRWVTNSENIINQDGRSNINQKNIYIKKCKGGYQYIVVQIKRNKKMLLNKHCDTLENAIIARDEFLNAYVDETLS